jgi:thiamine pyrophosphokinase
VSTPARAAVVFAAAPVEASARLTARLATLGHPFVVAADGGAATALAFGLRPDVVIGDLDSMHPATLTQLEANRVAIETFPRDKDATDGQLAVERALEAQPNELILLGFLGGPRLDQAIANILLLVQLELPVTLVDERNECVLLRPGREHTWRPESGEIVSLIPVVDAVQGVRTQGLRWALEGERLAMGDTRGISNEPTGDAEARVSIERGLLLITRHFPQ